MPETGNQGFVTSPASADPVASDRSCFASIGLSATIAMD